MSRSPARTRPSLVVDVAAAAFLLVLAVVLQAWKLLAVLAAVIAVSLLAISQ